MRTHECDNNLLLLNFTQYMIIKPIHSWLHKLQTKHVVLKRTTHSRSTDIHVHTKTHLCFWAIPLFSSCAIESYSLKSIIVLLKSIIVFFQVCGLYSFSFSLTILFKIHAPLKMSMSNQYVLSVYTSSPDQSLQCQFWCMLALHCCLASHVRSVCMRAKSLSKYIRETDVGVETKRGRRCAWCCFV